MADEILTNPRAERVKAVRALAGQSVRKRAGRFVVEGPQAVREAVLAADVHDVYVTAASAAAVPGDRRRARTSGGSGCTSGTAEVLDAMSPDAQQVVAVASLTAHALADLAGPRLVAVLANVRDPGNAGTVIRAADAAGADAARAHRRERRRAQPEGRPVDGRVAVPPAGRHRRGPGGRRSRRCAPPG